MKAMRHAQILKIIRREAVATQEELCAILNKEGYAVTQATVSRDIRELKLTKVSDGQKQRYVRFADQKDGSEDAFGRVFFDGTVTVDNAGNLLVIRTVSGMAMAVAAAIDAMDYEEMVGTIAGDDTVMCAVRTPQQALQLKEQLLAQIRERENS